MIPVHQTTFYSESPEGRTRGNCYVACVASILEFPIHAVPDWPRTAYGQSNWEVFRDHWLNYYEKEIEVVGKAGSGRPVPFHLRKREFIDGYWWPVADERDETEVLPHYVCEDEEYYIVSGPSPRFKGRIWHACIWHKGEIVHDPMPEDHNEGVSGLREYREWEIIKPVMKWDPTK